MKEVNNNNLDEEIVEDYSDISAFKKNVHDEVFLLSYRGKGGWPWSISYTMPIHLRKYYLKQINDMIEKENAEMKKQTKTKSGIKVPKILPVQPNTSNSNTPKKNT